VLCPEDRPSFSNQPQCFRRDHVLDTILGLMQRVCRVLPQAAVLEDSSEESSEEGAKDRVDRDQRAESFHSLTSRRRRVTIFRMSACTTFSYHFATNPTPAVLHAPNLPQRQVSGAFNACMTLLSEEIEFPGSLEEGRDQAPLWISFHKADLLPAAACESARHRPRPPPASFPPKA
jgi:hypothetical protein